MRYFFSIVLFLIAVDHGLTSETKSDQEIEKLIRGAIAQRHPSQGKDWWQGLGPGAPAVMIRVYKTNQSFTERLRILSALAWFDDPVSEEFLKKQLDKSDQDAVKKASMKSLAISQGKNAVKEIEPYLENSDPQLRLAAASALRRILEETSDESLKSRMEEYFQNEKVSWVKMKAQGKLPVPANAVKDPEHPYEVYLGSWKGYRIYSDEKGILKSIPLSVSFEKFGKYNVEGVATFDDETGKAKKQRIFKIEKLKDGLIGVLGSKRFKLKLKKMKQITQLILETTEGDTLFILRKEEK